MKLDRIKSYAHAILEDAGLLAVFTHPSHSKQLCFRPGWHSRFIQFSPTRILNDLGYKLLVKT